MSHHKHKWELWKQDIFAPKFALDAPPDLLQEMEKTMYTYRWCTTPGCYMVQKCRMKVSKRYYPIDERQMMCDHNIEEHDNCYPVPLEAKP